MPILKQQVDSSPNSLQILCLSSVSWKICPLYFFSSNNIHFAQKKTIKNFWEFLRVLRSKFVKFFMSILKRQVDSSPSFASLFSFMKDYSSVLFSSNNIYFAQKEPIKVEIFETFECSGQILLNSLCQFSNDRSIPLQILYLSSVSWKIIPLYFFSSKNIYFAQKKPSKMKIFEASKCSGHILSNGLWQFSNDKSIPLQILYLSSFSWKITPLYFFLAKTIHSLLIMSPLKWKSLRLSSPQVKICQIRCANIETVSRFLPKFCIPLQFHER